MAKETVYYIYDCKANKGFGEFLPIAVYDDGEGDFFSSVKGVLLQKSKSPSRYSLLAQDGEIDGLSYSQDADCLTSEASLQEIEERLRKAGWEK